MNDNDKHVILENVLMELEDAIEAVQRYHDKTYYYRIERGGEVTDEEIKSAVKILKKVASALE